MDSGTQTSLLHVTDTHLGYEAYGLSERAEDFAGAFREIVALALDSNVEAVVHTGDITHSDDVSESVPSVLLDGLSELADADIPFYTILGNHDLAGGEPQSWIPYLESNNLLHRLGQTPTIVGDIALYGVDYNSSDWWDDPQLAFEPSEEAQFSLLCLHQSVAPLAPGEPECDLREIFSRANVTFDAVALGHSHYTAATNIDGVPVFYGGATERTSRTYSDDEPCVHRLEIGDEHFQRYRHHLDARPFVTLTMVLGSQMDDNDIERALRAAEIEGSIVHLLVGGVNTVPPSTIERIAEQAGALDVNATRVDIEDFDPGVWAGSPTDLADDRDRRVVAFDGGSQTTAETRLLHVGATYVGRYNVDGGRRDDFTRTLQFAVDEALTRDVDAVVQTGNLFGTKSPSGVAVERCRDILQCLDDDGIPCYHVPSEREVSLNAIDELVADGVLQRLTMSGEQVGDIALYGLETADYGGAIQTLAEADPIDAGTHLLATHQEISPPLSGGTALRLLTEETDIPVDGVLGGGHPEPAYHNSSPMVTYSGSAERLFGLYTFDNDIECPCEVTEITTGNDIKREQIPLPVRATKTFDFDLEAQTPIDDVTDDIAKAHTAEANVLVRLQGTAPPDGPDFESEIQYAASDAYLVSVWDKRQVDQSATYPNVNAEATTPPSAESDSVSADNPSSSESSVATDSLANNSVGFSNVSATATADETVKSTERTKKEEYSDAVEFEDGSRKEALNLLKQCIGPAAEFRPQQWEAIDGLVNRRERLLLVQRTGWGKSTVYFIATRLLRDRGQGPTLIISPLLSLMRNQIQDAEAQLGLEAITINSNNTDEWEEAKQAVVDGTCDLLLISPERLAKPEFRKEVLQEMERGFGMLVIDEAHCISDWGHDFRPDYRRIKRILQRLPDNLPVAATTATANDRVVDDVTDQIEGLNSLRGDLVRDSLRIQTNEIGSRAERLAWLAENVDETPVAGIVYCLTTAEVEAVADWLGKQGLDVLPYHGSLEGQRREELEQLLMENEIDALVATNALGMGFNKPDLGWVIHFQRPPNLIRYYQEIGRAGRALDESYAILLAGEEDDDIAEYFIEEAFPEPHEFDRILETITASDEPLSKRQIVRELDISWGTVGDCLKILQVEGALSREDDGYIRTANPWNYDHDRIEAVTEQRWKELDRIQDFVETDECLAQFIDEELDGNLDSNCGRCENCAGSFLPSEVQNDDLVQQAIEHYRTTGRQQIDPRYYMYQEDGSRTRISEHSRPETGRVLSIYDDPGWGQKVKEGKYETGRFADDLVTAAAELIDSWEPSSEPEWVTSIPSTSNEGLVSDFARRLADRMGLRYVETLTKVRETDPQKEKENSFQKCHNVRDAFDTNGAIPDGPVLLVDDIVGSRWTLTEASITLRENGSGPVLPFALAERRGW